MTTVRAPEVSRSTADWASSASLINVSQILLPERRQAGPVRAALPRAARAAVPHLPGVPGRRPGQLAFGAASPGRVFTQHHDA